MNYTNKKEHCTACGEEKTKRHFWHNLGGNSAQTPVCTHCALSGKRAQEPQPAGQGVAIDPENIPW